MLMADEDPKEMSHSGERKNFLNGYSQFTISRAGVLTDCVGPGWGIRFRLDREVSCLFPYINAEIEGARYHERPAYIQFPWKNVFCSLFAEEALAAPFAGEEEGRAFAEELIRFLNDLYERRSTIIPNYKKVKKLSVPDIYKLLPGSNCRDCGHASCFAFACALSRETASPADCPGFSRPISRSARYPVYDEAGNLRNTLELEIPAVSGPEQATPGMKESEPATSGLSPRETEVLRHLVRGATNREISEALHISPHTVKRHVVHIFEKLGVHDRTKAAVLALRLKIV